MMHSATPMMCWCQWLTFISMFTGTTGVAGGIATATKGTLAYPFTPPSEEFCKTNSAGDDTYTSFFKPCSFIFYRNIGPNPVKIDNFQCPSIDLNTESIISQEQRKILDWPDSCVATGPRCYALKDYPTLRNLTLFGDMEYSATFPSDADFLIVDCSADYAEALNFMKNLPEALGPFVNAVYFFSILMFVFLVICTSLCCLCMRTNRRDGYQTIAGVYRGPPVEARNISQKSSQEKEIQAVV